MSLRTALIRPFPGERDTQRDTRHGIQPDEMPINGLGASRAHYRSFSLQSWNPPIGADRRPVSVTGNARTRENGGPFLVRDGRRL